MPQLKRNIEFMPESSMCYAEKFFSDTVNYLFGVSVVVLPIMTTNSSPPYLPIISVVLTFPQAYKQDF